MLILIFFGIFFFINLYDLVVFKDGKIGKILNIEIFLLRI